MGREVIDARTERLLNAAIIPTLLRLSAPNMIVMVAQSAVGLVETYFIGKLGTDALAGVALVFPALMLMQMMSAGAMGGGIASAIARALGAGQRDRADSLVWHTLVIALLFGVAFMVLFLTFGSTLYAAMGATGKSLQAALTYSNCVFAGAILIWMFNSLAAVIRATGNMALPALVSSTGAVLLIPVSPALIFGWGPFPELGIAGGAIAVLVYYALGGLLFASYIWSGRSVVRPSLQAFGLRRALFVDILKVGLMAAVVTFTTNLTIMVGTALVGMSGAAAIAGYGTGSRLEYLLVPLVFGLGGPLVTMVATNIGAGQRERAVRIAWAGGIIAFVLTELIGVAAATVPVLWLSLFDTDPAMLEVGSRYLRTVGPFYGLFGLALSLYFASQGAARMFWPLMGNIARFVIASAAGWIGLQITGDVTAIFLAQSVALVAAALVNAGSIAGGAWFGPLHWPSPALAEGIATKQLGIRAAKE